MRYRLGKSHKDTVYRQLGEEPDSERDPRVAVFWEEELAARVVQLLNSEPESPPDMRSRRQGGRGAVAGGQPCGMYYTWRPDGAGSRTIGPCQFTGAHLEHRDEHGNEWGYRGLLVIESQPADEPAPVPPPVDRLLKLIEEHAEWRYMQGSCDGELKTTAADKMLAAANTALELVKHDVSRLWASGVAEGRRQATEESTEDEREHRADVTEKGCLGVGPGHGWGKPHFWRCSTPGCVGHLCRTEAVNGG